MPDRDDLYDRYLSALEAGTDEAPEAFAARHGAGDDHDLIRALAALRRLREGSTWPSAAGSNEPSGKDPPAPAVEGHAAPGRRLGDFILLRRLGAGGMGEVYVARQESLGRDVALKLIRADGQSPVAAARFEREARAAARLRHPGIVTVHAVGGEGRARYIAMELIAGRGLDEVLAQAAASRTALAVPRVIAWAAAIARALDYAHSRGVIHRDVKPSNILITPDDRPMLVDFGLARETDASAGMTLTEGFAGSPFYAAPEQIGRSGGATDGRTDVYSLGVVLYQCLTGRVPVEPGTLEQVLQSILVDDPPPPRSLNPAIPRDLELVVLKCIEKDPARRYATAGAVADDLDAILGHRTVSVRPAGRLERAGKWMRRNPARAAAVLSIIGAVLVIGGVLGGQRLAAASSRREAARAALGEARRLLDSLHEEFRSRRAMEADFQNLSDARVGRYFTDEEDRELYRMEDDILSARRRREQVHLSVLDLADRAVRLGADPDEASAIRGRLYFERLLEAEALSDRAGEAVYRGLAQGNDPTGELTVEIRRGATVTFVTDPPGAAVHLYKRVMLSELVPGGEPRQINVPYREATAPPWAQAWALRIEHGAGDLATGDHIFEIAGHPIRDCMLVASAAPDSPAASAGIQRLDRLERAGELAIRDGWGIDELASPRAPGRMDFVFSRADRQISVTATFADLGVTLATPAQIAEQGGAAARVWTSGGPIAAELPAGLRVRATAAPMPRVDAALVGHAPTQWISLEPGPYVALLTAPDGRSLRITFLAHRGERLELKVAIPAAAPPGMVCIASGPRDSAARLPFWIMDREVTLAEYLEFINDPDTLAKIDRSPVPILHPRDDEFPRGKRAPPPDGRFLVPDGWQPDWPVLAVSWHDAKAYAAWMTARARAAGRAETYDLPNDDEWQAAAGQSAGFHYPFGDRFRHKWVSSCRSRPRPDPEPVLRFPIDESSLGVFDMTGSVSEWTRSIWREGTDYYHFAGGNWAISIPRDFSIYGGNGGLPDRVSGMIGFRLVMRREQ